MFYLHTLPISYAVARGRLWDFNVVVRRGLNYGLLLLGVLAPGCVLVIVAQQATFGTISYGFSVAVLVLSVMGGFAFLKVRFKAEKTLNRLLFKKQYNCQEILGGLSREMMSMVDLESLSNSLVQTVGKSMRAGKVSLLLLDEIKGIFIHKTSVGFDRGQLKDLSLSRDDPLIKRMLKKQELLMKEELDVGHHGREDKETAVCMGRLGAEIAIPLVSKGKLIGLLNLGHREGRKIYSCESMRLLSMVAKRAAMAVENARLYADLRQSQNLIRRADRLSSLGVLTAGLAHEIRNPLVAIRTFTQLLPERYEDREFREEFQVIALREVDRICGLVNDLLSFARPSTHHVTSEDVNEVLESIIRILETQAKERGVQIDRRLLPDLPKIWIDKEQLKQVFMNVILNAIESMEGGGAVVIATRLFQKDSEQFVEVGVRDTGVGIPEEDLENIFNPFFTTKKNGSGLGLSISNQIIQEHRGYMLVESKPGEGTTFLIHLAVEENYA
jgi:signal transduction histidine kinase